MPNWYSSSGDTGDLIYQLCACKVHNEYQFGGEPFDVYLFDHPGKTMHGMNPERVASIRTLLIKQPYINDVIWTTDHKDSNVNGFRAHGSSQNNNLAKMALSTLGMPNHKDEEPWMVLEDKYDCDVVIARSQRYHGQLNYGKVLEKYKDRCIFVGMEWEWHAFTKDFGFVQWAHTPTLLDVAMYINGSRLFVGNQSCPMSIAIALGKPFVQEICHYIPNCIFNRDNAIYVWEDRLMELPEL